MGIFFSNLFDYSLSIKYLDEITLIDFTIITLTFYEKPEYILYLKDNTNNYYYYKGRINKYPNYILKNNQNLSKNLFKNIKIKSIYWHENENNNYYSIEDYDNNFFKLYSDRLCYID